MPLADVPLVITGNACAMFNVRLARVVPLELVAPKLTTLTPAAVGVPEINPVLVLTLNPAGNPLAL